MKKKMSAELPIISCREEIVKAVKNNRVVVITGETGSGKSTQVPQYLLEMGFEHVVVTEPRRVAVETLAKRVAEERGEKVGGTVGYRMAGKNVSSDETKILFVTDGLALVQKLVGWREPGAVIVIDELEWNTNQEVLIAWLKFVMEKDEDLKVVLMSATLEPGIETFMGGVVIDVPGRMFPIRDRCRGLSPEDDVEALLQERRNVLVFQPGKQEIDECITELKRRGVKAVLLPLHADLTAEEQDRCFVTYPKPLCVVATKVAESAVTISCIDAVVTTGLERVKMVKNKVEGLFLQIISEASLIQQRGRAGRTKEGIFVNHMDGLSPRPFPVPEIRRVLLNQLMLRLKADANMAMWKMEFFHKLDENLLKAARRSLRTLRLLDQKDQVTPLGIKVARMPMSVQFGRMIVAGDRLKVTDSIITLAAIAAVGAITSSRDLRWKKLCWGETESDVLAQISIVDQMTGKDDHTLFQNGILIAQFHKMLAVRKHLRDLLRGKVKFGSTKKREDIIRAFACGMMEHLYRRTKDGRYAQGEKDTVRDLSKLSAVDPRNPKAEWIIGIPWDTGVAIEGEEFERNLIQMATIVSPKLLTEVAPHLVTQETGVDGTVCPKSGSVVSTTRTLFHGQPITEIVAEDPDHPEAFGLISAHEAEKKEAGRLLSLLKEFQLHEHWLEVEESLRFMVVGRINQGVPPSPEDLSFWIERSRNLVFGVALIFEGTEVIVRLLQGIKHRRNNLVHLEEVFNKR